MFGLIRRWRRKKIVARPVPAAWHEIVARNAPFAAELDEAGRARLMADIAVFVAEKTFIGAKGFEITDEVEVTIAAAAARLVHHLGIGLYDDLTEIVVYPGAYRHPDREGAILGEAHTWGVVVLSWEAVLHGLRDPDDGHDTALHEFAHVLDRRDGSFDGAPELRAHDHYRAWAAVMSHHYQRLRKGKRRNRPPLRDYGATNEAEFFAVATEVFFEKPEVLRRKAPDLYDELARFYLGETGRRARD